MSKGPWHHCHLSNHLGSSSILPQLESRTELWMTVGGHAAGPKVCRHPGLLEGAIHILWLCPMQSEDGVFATGRSHWRLRTGSKSSLLKCPGVFWDYSQDTPAGHNFSYTHLFWQSQQSAPKHPGIPEDSSRVLLISCKQGAHCSGNFEFR